MTTVNRLQWLACANPHSLEVARDDTAFAVALHSADLLVPDGVGMVLASRIMGGRIRARVTGSDIFLALNAALSARGGTSCFFLGSTDENLAAIREKMAADFPGVRVAGIYSPPFRDEFTAADDAAMVAAVNAAAPDVLWVGMTAPKQEKWIHRNLTRLETVRFAAAVGAVFDFYTGRVKRSHPAFRRLGLEWLPRLLRQPRRLWRRNFVSNPRFLMRVVRERMRRDSPPRRWDSEQ
ncbi:MAG TPA: WecB/TagA/CpsF family glycosyltransferase [Acidobacteriota bacterium]|nr:WecB/TagA/CpsF family glycosyltransferase [Acidobacteriota bacterium]HQM64960.1 WecB/TagA/CpsF family glycosyltransferase [Acidobacteriota bacterium]